MTNSSQFRIVNLLIRMPRALKPIFMVLLDAFLLTFSVWMAYCLKLGELFRPNGEQLLLMFSAPILAMPGFLRLGLYRSVIRYVGEQALWSIIKGMSLATVLWTVVAFMTQLNANGQMPRTIPILYWLIGIVLIGGSRFFARWILWLPVRRQFSGRQVLIYGAGDAGRLLAVSLRQGGVVFPMAFIDDNRVLHGKDVDGLRIYAPAELDGLTKRFDIHDIIIALPSASGARRREVVSFLEHLRLRVRILPPIMDVSAERHLVNLVREVDIGDLLGRDQVQPDAQLLRKCVTGKVVLVTGAGGSIGGELARQIATMAPARIVLLDVSEFGLYEIDRILRPLVSCDLIPYLGSVADAQLVRRVLAENGVQTVYHAAAHKHVPLIEANVLQGAFNNVLGMVSLTEAAFDAGVETFVLISSDKAVRPTNVMGATKRWAELIVRSVSERAASANTGQNFCAVRFGNVLGSRGSVIPLFKEQIAQGGPVTLTHTEVTRYFMSIHEAVQLVIQAGSLSGGGEVFMLDMGEPVRILDLARNMIRLAGQSCRDEQNPDGDIEIAVTGLRPGEKLHEELLIASENVTSTSHPKISRADEPGMAEDLLQESLRRLQERLRAQDIGGVRSLLMEVAESGLSGKLSSGLGWTKRSQEIDEATYPGGTF